MPKYICVNISTTAESRFIAFEDPTPFVPSTEGLLFLEFFSSRSTLLNSFLNLQITNAQIYSKLRLTESIYLQSKYYSMQQSISSIFDFVQLVSLCEIMWKVWRFAEEDDWSAEQSRGNADEGASLNFVRERDGWTGECW